MARIERTCGELEITQRLGELPGWIYKDGAIRRVFTTDGWRSTSLVVGAIAFACEAADHHADLTTSWSRIEVALHTHSAGGITERDFETAALIERTVLWRPDAGSALTGPPKPFVW